VKKFSSLNQLRLDEILYLRSVVPQIEYFLFLSMQWAEPLCVLSGIKGEEERLKFIVSLMQSERESERKKEIEQEREENTHAHTHAHTQPLDRYIVPQIETKAVQIVLKCFYISVFCCGSGPKRKFLLYVCIYRGRDWKREREGEREREREEERERERAFIYFSGLSLHK